MLSSLLRDVGRIPDVGVLVAPSDNVLSRLPLPFLSFVSLFSFCASRSLTTSIFFFSYFSSIIISIQQSNNPQSIKRTYHYTYKTMHLNCCRKAN